MNAHVRRECTGHGTSRSSPPTEVALSTCSDEKGRSSAGVLAKRLRVFVSSAVESSAAGLPLIGIRRLSFDACDYPRALAPARIARFPLYGVFAGRQLLGVGFSQAWSSTRELCRQTIQCAFRHNRSVP